MDNNAFKKRPIEKLRGLLNFAGVNMEDFLPYESPQPAGVHSDHGPNFLADFKSVISDNINVISSASRVDRYFQDGSVNLLEPDHNEKMWFLMKDMLDSWPDAIFFKNRTGHLILVNEAHAQGMRSKFLDVIGKTDWDLFPKEEADLMARDDEYVMRTGKPIIDKVEYITFGDGTRHYVSITKVPRRDENGQIIGLMGISRDITGNLYQTLFATYRGCMFISTKDGQWFDINEEGARMFGYRNREDFLAQTKVHDIYWNRNDRKKYMREIEENEGVKNYEMCFRKKDNSPINVQITATTIIKDGRVWGYNGTIRDVTVERRAKDEDQKKIKSLSRTVSKLRKFILRFISGGLKLFAESEEEHISNNLTAKQKELFPLFILGKSDDEIAELTNSTKETVSRCRYQIYNK